MDSGRNLRDCEGMDLTGPAMILTGDTAGRTESQAESLGHGMEPADGIQ